MHLSLFAYRGSIGRGSILARANQYRNLQTLTLNAGSTTLKYALYDVNKSSGSKPVAGLLASGMIDRVGKPDATITHNKKVVDTAGTAINTHVDALQQALSVLQKDFSQPIECIGHRVVHGGPMFTEPTLLTPEVIAELQSISNLAPLHNPPALAGIQASQELFPDATQVAVFDTAFHVASMPPSSYRYAIPQEWYEKYNIRKYGFHGTSYHYVLGETAQYLGKPAEQCNLIVFHLGGGASMCCIKKGQSVDTTMGLTPLEGLAMASRCGDLDVGVVDYLVNTQKIPFEDIITQLNRQSGLLGLSGGLTSDMRVIIDKAHEGDATCQMARKVFAERCRKYLGAYWVKLQGQVDAIVFAGGIGEGDTEMRQMILEGLSDGMNLAVDATKNELASTATEKRIMEIHPALSKTKVLVCPTDEEVSIALQSASLTKVLPGVPSWEETQQGPLKPIGTKAKMNLFCHSLGHTYTGPEELGLLRVFAATMEDVGYFRPIGRGGALDYRVALMRDHFGWSDPAETMYGISEEEAWTLLAAGQEDELFERILQKYLAYAETKDFVLVSTFTQEDDSLHFAAKLCSALNLPSVLVGDAENAAQFGIAQTAFAGHGASCIGVIVSNVSNEADERAKLQHMKLEPIALLPPNPLLAKRTMREAMEVLDDSVVLYGAEHLDSTMDSMRIYTVQVDDMLDMVVDNELAIVNCRRVDSLMSLIVAAQSSNAPTPAGLLFTLYKNGDMNPKLTSLLDGLKDIRIPIVATSLDTIEAGKILDLTPPFLTAESKAKINEATTAMETHFDYGFLDQFRPDQEDAGPQRDIGPRLFQYSTFLKARQLQKTIVLPEGADPRVVEAAAILVKRQLCKVILIGDPIIIKANAEARRVMLDGITLVDPQTYGRMDEMVDAFVEARKSKGLTANEAKQHLLEDVNYFGTLMMHLGLADGMVSGAMHSSANTIRPALQILKTAPDASLVSSIFFMLLEDGVKVFGDCAINTMPNADQLAEIAVASAKTAKQFGIDPRVALLSYATGDSNKGELIDKVIQATQSARVVAESEGLSADQIAGPLQFDAAVDPAVAAVKARDNPVAGLANVLIFPDLNSGNNGYKAVQQASKTIAVGPILQGLRKPVNDLSRGATVDDIVNTAVITCLQTEN